MQSTAGKELYLCYLLRSRHPKANGRSYIGFTVDPVRRLRQHNGEIANGAYKTSKWRPWDMVLVVYGFPQQTQALQFEWAWQHPEKSRDVREAAARLGRTKRYGVGGKIAILMEMLNTDPWKYFPLSVQFLCTEAAAARGSCLSQPPPYMPVFVEPIETLVSKYAIGASRSAMTTSVLQNDILGVGDAEDEVSLVLDSNEAALRGTQNESAERQEAGLACGICAEQANRTWFCCPDCRTRVHIECLARHFLQPLLTPGQQLASDTLPSHGNCPQCHRSLSWSHVLLNSENIGWSRNKKKKAVNARQPRKVPTLNNNGNAPRGRPRKTQAVTASEQWQQQCSNPTNIDDSGQHIDNSMQYVSSQQQLQGQKGEANAAAKWDVELLSSSEDDSDSFSDGPQEDDLHYNGGFSPAPWDDYDYGYNGNNDESSVIVIDGGDVGDMESVEEQQQRRDFNAESDYEVVACSPAQPAVVNQTDQVEVIDLVTPERRVSSPLPDECIVIDDD